MNEAAQLRSCLLGIMNQGVHADAAGYWQWLQMYNAMVSSTLSKEMADFNHMFQTEITGKYAALFPLAEPVSVEEVRQVLEGLATEGLAEILPSYHEYRLKNSEQWNFLPGLHEVFFVTNSIQHGPLQFIRSKIQNFCDYLHISENVKDEIIIAVIEAAENAIKYASHPLIVFRHDFSIENSFRRYRISICNTVDELNIGHAVEQGKFSGESSLMRGVLVMDKLLDHLDIHHNTEMKRVEFSGEKIIS